MKGQRLGEFEELILLAIRAHREGAHTVAIQAVLQSDAGRTASLGAIYAALERLERKGFAESWLGEPTANRGGRSKRFYKVTTEGGRAVGDSRRVRERMWESGRKVTADEHP